MALGPTEIGGWIVGGATVAATVARGVWPLIREWRGKGEDPGIPALLKTSAANSQLAADNSTLLVSELSQVRGEQQDLKGQMNYTQGQIRQIQAHADLVPELVAEMKRSHDRHDRTEEFLGLKPVAKVG